MFVLPPCSTGLGEVKAANAALKIASKGRRQNIKTILLHVKSLFMKKRRVMVLLICCSKYPSPKGSALITPARGSIVNATRCELRVTGFGVQHFVFFLH